MSALVLAGAYTMVLVGALTWLWLGGLSDPPREESTGAVSMWPYVGVCFLSMVAKVVVGVSAKVVWSFNAPVLSATVGTCIVFAVPAWLFYRRYRRSFFPIEGCWLALGGFGVVWCFDLVSVVARLSHGGGWTSEEVENDIIATVIDFLLVCLIMLCVTLALRICASVSRRRLTIVGGDREAR